MDAHFSGISPIFDLMNWTQIVASQVKKLFVGQRVVLMKTGKVKFYSGQKGFGFIEPDDGQPDVFVHVTALERSGIDTLSDGQSVSFNTEIDPRNGKTAVSKIELL